MTAKSQSFDLSALRQEQLAKLRLMLPVLCANNPFYGPRLAAVGLDGELADLETFCSRMPLTSKQELVDDQLRHPPYGTNLTYPLQNYTRLHQTSGTSGTPMRWLDTAESWEWMLLPWRRVFQETDVGPQDRLFFPFSFGLFLGFWTAFEAAQRHGCLAIAGGGMGSTARLHTLLNYRATVLCTTPTYAIRLAEVAVQEGVDLSRCGVRRVIVAGEPGGAVPAIRQRISELWKGAQVYDHYGMTEVGPVSFPNPRRPRVMHVLESSYLAEVLDPRSGEAVPAGELGELVLTNLGRLGSPLLRYRTGDIVRRSQRSAAELGVAEMAFEGGILARADDMVVVRGVNLYPSAVDEVIRSDAEVAEYQVELNTEQALAEVEVRVEPVSDCPDPRALTGRLQESLRHAFQMRIPVQLAPAGELPRFEFKAQRWLKKGG